MNRIRLLSEQVANQIAAGEVVERPASVVKELVENSLDAQATQITVEMQAGGRSLIRVTDDGTGMSRDDALLSLERHATSKIETAHDLSTISTMGFRGEALPSIASVSRMTITTAERGSSDGSGTQIVIHGGKILEVKAAGRTPGTTIEVRQIFFNLPARRKFLRSEETERAHIQHYMLLAALAHPAVAFTFLDEGRVVWQLPALDAAGPGRQMQALSERLKALYSTDLKLLPVDSVQTVRPAAPMAENGQEAQMIRVWGYIGAPGVSRGTREDQHLFVNRRPVENRGLNYALMEGYHTALMKGRYPVCCLFLEIDPAAVDVNIHPSKREVKFHQEGVIRRLLTEIIREALLKFHDASGGSPRPPSLRLQSEIVAPPPPETKVFPNLIPPEPTAPVRAWPSHKAPESPPPPARFEAVQVAPPPPLPLQPVPLLAVPLRVVGVIGRLYVVLESDRGLVLLDQHAAHERILYEQMLDRLEQGSAPSQRLLLPETVELSPRDTQFLKEQLSVLTRLGVGLSEFGERTFLLDALPPFVKMPDSRRFVIELIDQLKAAGQEVNSWRLGEQTIAKTVCRHAVKANDPLAGPELDNLVNDLRHCRMPYTCPHGRPTLIEMNFRELERKFGRAQ